jgi:hypothetical protein
MVDRSAIAGVVLTLLASSAAAAWLARPTDVAIALGRFALASCVPSKQDAGGRYWNSTLLLRTDTSVRVTAEERPSSFAHVEFSDGTKREITARRDYVYPHDIRIAGHGETLWILTSGLGGGVFPEAHLYEYNLPSRTLVRALDVDPNDLPTACPDG